MKTSKPTEPFEVTGNPSEHDGGYLKDSQRTALIAQGKYPSPIYLSDRIKVWSVQALKAWLAERVALSPAVAAKHAEHARKMRAAVKGPTGRKPASTTRPARSQTAQAA